MQKSFEKILAKMCEAKSACGIYPFYRLEPIVLSHNLLAKIPAPCFFPKEALSTLLEEPFHQLTLDELIVHLTKTNRGIPAKQVQALQRFLLEFSLKAMPHFEDYEGQEEIKRGVVLTLFEQMVEEVVKIRTVHGYFYTEELLSHLFKLRSELAAFRKPINTESLRIFYKKEEVLQNIDLLDFETEELFLSKGFLSNNLSEKNYLEVKEYCQPYYALYDLMACNDLSNDFIEKVMAISEKEKSSSFAFKVGLENERELLAARLAKIFKLEECLLQKESIEISCIQIGTHLAPKGLVCQWIEPQSESATLGFEEHLLLDLLLGSYDSHPGQYIIDNQRYRHIDYARFALPSSVYTSEEGTYALFCSHFLGKEGRFSDSMISLIDTLTLEEVRKQLDELVGKEETFKETAFWLNSIVKDASSLCSSPESATILEVAMRYQMSRKMVEPQEEFHSRLLKRLFERKEYLQKLSFTSLHPKSCELIIERFTKLKACKEKSWKEIFATLYPHFVPFTETLKLLGQHPGINLSYQIDNNRLVKRSLESIIENAKSKNLEIQAMENAIIELKKEAATLGEILSCIDLVMSP